MKKIRCTHFFDWGSVPERFHECVLREFAENGARELSMPNSLVEAMMTTPGKALEIRRRLEKTGVTMPDAHGLWSGLWDLGAKDSFMRDHAAAGHRLSLEIMADFGVKTCTVHIGRGDCVENGGRISEDMRKRALGMLEAILPTAERLGIILCVENQFSPPSTPLVVADCIRHFGDSPAIGCCFDVGHAHLMDPEVQRPEGVPIVNHDFEQGCWGGHIAEGMFPMKEVFRILAPYIVTAHVHDNSGLGDEHLSPGQGNCDFDFVFSELAKCPRLQSIQNETSFAKAGVSIGHACRLFDGLMSKLKEAAS